MIDRDIQNEYEYKSKEKCINSQGEPDIDYVIWLEKELIKARTKAENLPISGVRISLDRYHQTLKSIDSRIDGAKNADSVNERIWHLDLARKMIREELYLYPLHESSES